LIEFQLIQAALSSASSSARACITILYTTQKEKVVVRQLHWSDLNFVSEPRGVCFIVRTGEQFCRDLVREWRLRHARVMTCDAPADDGAKAAAVAAVEAHVDAHRPCTVPQLHLPSGCFHPTVEKKQLEHSDVSSAACSRYYCACAHRVLQVCLFPLQGFRPQSIDRRALTMQQCAAKYPHPDSLIFPSGHPMCRDCTRQYCTWIVANTCELPLTPATQLKVNGCASPSRGHVKAVNAPRNNCSQAVVSVSSPGLGPRSRAEMPPEFLLAPPAAKPRGQGYGGYL
jgi:hypothetical protein